ncbi:T9SS type A sorting domain-containing protein [Winogradskyella sp. MH6]|uniref:T9SS type A sorting domain-containing protein n=1 Tax=Winogradskyella sp. MH6 TaxID=2929510 RepID=UPI001FB3D596|nr:T9SS type A sorting domain-containing protein [Winogradskyella sp. MH6]
MKSSFIFSYVLVLFWTLFNHLHLFISTPKSNDLKTYKTAISKTVMNFTSQGQLRLSLYESSALGNNESPADGLLIFFDTEGNNDVDINDALDIPNLDENFSTNNNGVLLSIESRATPIDEEEIQLEVNTYRSTNYTIVAEGISMQCATAFLYDDYLGISIEIPQSGTANYDYSIISGVSASIANNRFKIIFAADASQLTWNGSVSDDWNNSDNWTPNEVPGLCSEVTIPETERSPQILEDMTIAALNINSGINLTVPNGKTLNVSGDLNMYSESDSYSGLIVKGTITVEGTAKYHRYANSESNDRDLIAPPLTGQSWTSFLANDNNYNSNILFNNGVEPPNTVYLFGPFEKGNTDDYLVYNYNTTETLDSGKGYRVATNTSTNEANGEPLIFTGTIVTSSVNVTIENDFTGNFPEWNLIGNPYTSYIDVNAFLNHVGSVSGVSNLSLLGEDTAAIYGYDANDTDESGSNWTITNLLEGPDVIAPGQGFFVSSKLSSANLEFTPNMQVESHSDDFIIGRTSNDVDFVKIRLNSLSDSCTTSIYFHNNASLGLDIGYDAAVFGGSVSDFALYSHLVENNEGTPMAIQAVNSSDTLDIIIPLGVNSNQDEELRFSIAEIALPSTINIYLEDAITNTTTLLNNTDYVVLPEITLLGTGRFFLRITESVLSTIQNNLDSLNVFVVNSTKELIVKGQLQESTTLTLYDLYGREVFLSELDSSIYDNRIDISSLNGGAYIIYLQSDKWQKSIKAVID